MVVKKNLWERSIHFFKDVTGQPSSRAVLTPKIFEQHKLNSMDQEREAWGRERTHSVVWEPQGVWCVADTRSDL